MRGSRIGWSAFIAACVMAGPAGATHHKTAHAKQTHRETSRTKSHHATSTHQTASTQHGKSKDKGKHRTASAPREERKPAGAAGATTVPAGGIKLYCGPGKSPLMVRKMTQGAGTSVTVICR